MAFDRPLLTDQLRGIQFPPDLKSCAKTHGLYSTMHFVLRLSADVHRTISSTPSGIYSASQLSPKQVQAFSTYFHETIHWWQHIGTTAGLMLSLSYPVQAHANYSHLKRFLDAHGPKKSVLKFSEAQRGQATHLSNLIVNNYMDIEFYKVLTTRPDLIPSLVESPYFENVGHCFAITYGNTIAMLARSVDRDCAFLPDARKWDAEFDKLRKERVSGFYHGSDMVVPPVGLREIFEGQARFSQLQYLHAAFGERYSWSDYRDQGMMGSVYVQAFELFLKLVNAEWPASPNDPLVALFLLVCDIACNPAEGFPVDIPLFETFHCDADPCFRFYMISSLIGSRQPGLKAAIRHCSKTEYIEVSNTICDLAKLLPATLLSQTVATWANKALAIQELLNEEEQCSYREENLPVRLLLAKFILFQLDKLRRPEVFCWPGVWLAGQPTSEEQDLFERHQAMFADNADDSTIVPTLSGRHAPQAIQATFNSFYDFNAMYDMVRQWIIRPGPFVFDYTWLTSSPSDEQMRVWAKQRFEQMFAIDPEVFEVL